MFCHRPRLLLDERQARSLLNPASEFQIRAVGRMFNSSRPTGPPCGVPGTGYPLCSYIRFQVPPNQLQHPLVANMLRNPARQHVMVDPVEELLQINVHHIATAFTLILCRTALLPDAHSARPEAAAQCRKERLQHLMQACWITGRLAPL